VALPQTAALDYDTAGPGTFGPGTGTTHVRLDVSELVVEVTWSVKPFVWDSKGCNVERTRALLPLERGIVTARLTL